MKMRSVACVAIAAAAFLMPATALAAEGGGNATDVCIVQTETQPASVAGSDAESKPAGTIPQSGDTAAMPACAAVAASAAATASALLMKGGSRNEPN